MEPEFKTDFDQFVAVTVSALTGSPEHRAAWLLTIQNMLTQALQEGEETRAEAEFLSALEGLLQGTIPSLPEKHPYASYLAEVKAQFELATRSDEQLAVDILNAVQELLAAEDWKDTKQVMEIKQHILFLPQTDDLFKVFILQAQAQKDQEGVKVLRLHQRLVQIARQDGIPAAFARLEAALQS